MNLYNDKNYKELFNDLKIDCNNCFGLCCISLYFSKSEGFPTNKKSGVACNNLDKDFRCKIHSKLRDDGLKGCSSYDCFGAGQKVSKVIYKDKSWVGCSKEKQEEMFDVFVAVRNIHEMIWYLNNVLILTSSKSIENKIKDTIKTTEELTNLTPKSILQINLDLHRLKVNSILKEAIKMAQKEIITYKKIYSKGKDSIREAYDFIGKNLTKINLIGENLAGALFIASDLSNCDLTGANLIGADLRDANIKGANLSQSLFLTQSQINHANGDKFTKLPKNLQIPFYWD